jgi:hypothetical protein
MKYLAGPGTQRSIVDSRIAHLQQQVCTSPGLAHLRDLFMRRLTRKFAVPSVIELPTR